MRILSFLTMCCAATLYASSATITIQSPDNSNARDGNITLTEAILISNGELSVDTLDADEQALVDGTPGENDAIQFNIPGDGPHEIELPSGVGAVEGTLGFPPIRGNGTILDGYSQPGSSPNTNSILEPNNANIQIVISALTSNTNSDFDMLAILGDNVKVMGISFVGDQFAAGAANYGVNWRGSATGGQVAGCWVGIHPDQETIGNMEIGVGVCCGTGGGHIIGTNGDGVDDVHEFNVIAGHNVNTIIEEAPNCRISGNFIGIMPDGLTPATDFIIVNITEGDAVEGAGMPNTIVGTNSDGVSDELERNIIGGMNNDVLSFWGDHSGLVIAGNYIGVGIDGETAIPNDSFFRMFADIEDLRVGPDFDGNQDELESNIIANTQTLFFGYQASNNFDQFGLFALRGNTMFNNSLQGDGLSGSAFGRYLISEDPEDFRPVLNPDETTSSMIAGTLPITTDDPDVNSVEVDLYLADPNNLERPQGMVYIQTFVDDSAEDMNNTPGEFAFQVSNFDTAGLSDELYLTVAANAIEANGTATSLFSIPVRVDAPTGFVDWALY